MAGEPRAGRRGDDPWGQEAVLDDLMACPAWQDWDPAGDGMGGPPGWEPLPGAGGIGADGPGPQASGSAEAGRVLRDAPEEPSAAGSGFFPPGRGFSAGGAFDTARTGPALAGRADAAAGRRRDYAGLDDDQLIGVMVAWQKTEAWAAAGRLSAAAELICRRPGEPKLARRGSGHKSSPPPGDQASPPSAADSPSAPGAPGPGSSASASASASAASSPNASGPPSPGSSASASASAGAGSGTLPLPGGFGGKGVRPIPAEFGEFAADELAVALACSRWAAERMLALAYDLAARLPLTAAALNDGLIDAYKAQIIAEATRVLDDAAAAAAEAMILYGIDGLTPGQIRIRIGRAVLKADPKAGRTRREQAQKEARVLLWREDAGTAALCGYSLPPDEALAADQIVQAHALELKAAGIPGTMDQLRARSYLDILLGKNSAVLAEQEPGTSGPGNPGVSSEPGGGEPCGSSEPSPDACGGPGANGGSTKTGGPGVNGRPGTGTLPARIHLTIPLATLLGLADHPGEASGFGPVDAALARDMANRAATHPSTSWCLTVTDPDGRALAHGCARPGPRRKPRRGTTRESGPPGNGMGPPGDYGTWRLPSGLLGLRQDNPELTFDLDPIAVTDCDHRYQASAHDPSDRLRHLVEIRDAECTWPPCRRAARRCDFEHAIPWEQGGKTCACNGGPRCRHHHRQKQAPGWKLTQDLPGYHTWTTPSGRSYTSGPATYPI